MSQLRKYDFVSFPLCKLLFIQVLNTEQCSEWKKKKKSWIIKINKDKMRNKALNKDHKPAFPTHRCVSPWSLSYPKYHYNEHHYECALPSRNFHFRGV